MSWGGVGREALMLHDDSFLSKQFRVMRTKPYANHRSHHNGSSAEDSSHDVKVRHVERKRAHNCRTR